MSYERPNETELAKRHRWFAVETNNESWRTTEREALTEEEKTDLLLTSCASAYHWRKVGTEHNRAHADLLLARVHALRGEGVEAMRYAQAAETYFTGRSSEPWELAFLHAVLANAAAASGDSVLHKEHYQQAQKIGEGLGDGDREIFLKTFNRMPAPSEK